MLIQAAKGMSTALAKHSDSLQNAIVLNQKHMFPTDISQDHSHCIPKNANRETKLSQ